MSGQDGQVTGRKAGCWWGGLWEQESHTKESSEETPGSEHWSVGLAGTA